MTRLGHLVPQVAPYAEVGNKVWDGATAEMHGTTLSFENIHQHGELFANILRERRETVVARNSWALPGSLGQEYDQYDTPASRWLAVHDDAGQVMAGVRLTPTTSQCGVYSYMLRDAQNGLLENMPKDLLFDAAPVEGGVWEVTRGFVSHKVPARGRHEVRERLVSQMLLTAKNEGVSKMLSLMPTNWNRWARRCHLLMTPAGPKCELMGNGYQAAWIDFDTPLQ